MAPTLKEQHLRSLTSSRPGTHAMFSLPSSLHSLDTGAAVHSSRSNSQESGHSHEAGRSRSKRGGDSPSPLPETLSLTLFDEMISLQRRIDDVRQSQDVHEQSLRDFIQQELYTLKVSLASEVQASKAECLDNSKSIQNFLEMRDGRWEEAMNKVIAFEQELSTQVAKQVVWKSERSNPQVESERSFGGNDCNGEVGKPKVESERPRESGVPPVLRQSHSQEERVWSRFQKEVEDVDSHTMYAEILGKKIAKRSFWHNFFRRIGCTNVVDIEMPTTSMAKLTEHPVFLGFQTILILSNTLIMGYETDLAIKAVLAQPKEEVPKWLSLCDFLFNITFGVELLFRIVALRSWFWVAPFEWGWNLFDVCLVTTSLASDLLNGVSFSFIRTFRILRAVRVMRIIRVLRFFRQLRQMLFAILACLGSLAWAFVFLAMIMFMFAILFLQGAVHKLQDIVPTSNEDIEIFRQIELWWPSLGGAMLSLLASVTGGADWLTVRKPITEAGQLYSIAFVVYTLFVIVGVMNVLTGVFLSSADEFVDLSLIVQNEQLRVETFCEQMLELFHELDLSHNGDVDWPTFREALKRDSVRAYLASLQLEPTHVRLLFDLLDENGSGLINVQQFVMGMVRLKGEAKAIDARIIEREINMLPPVLEKMLARNDGTTLV